jgi:tripartite-type tricarboxylate transporter receptor subunit TctC
MTRLGIPEMWKFIPKDEDRKAVELVVTQQVFGRPYVAPPGTPADRVEILRRAFDATMKDKAFLEDAEKARIDINPSPGLKVQQVVEKVYAAPRPIIDLAKDLVKP